MATPPLGLAKINVDAAMAKTFDLSAAATVARDEARIFFLGASVVVLEGITSPEVVEMIACREGLALASDCYCTSLGRLVTINAVNNIH
jgi:hypothetical protein